jgi:Ras-related protein Rab-1A
MDYDFLFKICVIGDSSVGKSSILLRYIDKEYTDNYLSTIGVDFRITTLEIEGKTIKLQIWDTAGQERFKTITSSYYKGCNSIIIVFSLLDLDSFEHVKTWLDEIEQFCKKDCLKVLVGNKCDKLDKRQVDYIVAKEFAENKNLIYIETSAKNNININMLFEILCESLYQRKKFILNDKEEQKI